MKRHWSFVVCDPHYVYPIAALLMIGGIATAFAYREATILNRFGNLIIGTGVWISLRYTLREGLSRVTNYSDNFPVLPGTNQLNMTYFNKAVFAIGDAQLQIHGLALVILGSVVGSFGDLVLKALFRSCFA